MSGTFYGIGTGPGEPELLTLKAAKRILETRVIAFPVSQNQEGKSCERLREECTACQIVLSALPELKEADKVWVPVYMPMTKDKEILARTHQEGAKTIARYLSDEDVVFLTLGDVTIYSTCIYLLQRVERMGFDTEIINGIPSFCAVSALLGEGLVENSQQLHVIPASYQIEEALALPGTKVLMKAGRKMKEVKACLVEQQIPAMMVENCGMEGEAVYDSPEKFPEEAGYYSLIIVKEPDRD